MKKTLLQVLGYCTILLIIASIIWSMMYKENERIKLEGTDKSVGNNTQQIVLCI